jgi:hypothetical protein
MNLLIHDLAAAIEREAVEDSTRDEFEVTPDAMTVEVARLSELRRQRGIARIADVSPEA